MGKGRNIEVGPLGATQVFPLFFCCLGSDQLAKLGSTQTSSSWTLVTLPSTAAADINRYCHCCQPLPMPQSLLDATAPVFGHCRRWSLPLPSSTAASVDCCRHRWTLLPSPSAAAAAAASQSRLCSQLLPTTSAASAAVGRYFCRLRSLPPSFTSADAVDCRLCQPSPPPLTAPAVTAGRSIHRPPWSPGGPSSHLCWWRRFWEPEQSRPIFP